ncbi:MAG: glutamate racemase [Micavibrio aeruginosavorus]|uniref:Glutamate racemase n=1 Tax=Micavibrio aeruginosavorus TaxID=349221 RepID=A0A7T5UI29_9BACT|nr:MAG: glutamate racemase [Micavibrio aeruginosavorus]
MQSLGSHFSSDPRPIGVFDSGIGGLTVLRALIRAMPGERFIYLGDTARVPYGTKSADTVRAYSLGLAHILMQYDVKMIVIACNTASVHAAGVIAEFVSPVPVISMVPTAAAAAIKTTKNKRILVMGTQSTIRSGAYAETLKMLDPSLQVTSVAAQLLVALAEEGWIGGPIARAAVDRYIGGFFDGDDRPDTIILGCTHFPLLRDVIADVAGPGVALIDCGDAASAGIAGRMSGKPEIKFLVTDAIERFTSAGERFLGIPATNIPAEHIDLTEILNTGLRKAS